MRRTLAILLLCSGTLHAQCSDAGVCSIGATEADGRYRFSVGYLFGRSGKADDLTFHSMEFSGSLSLFEHSRIQVSFPWSFNDGPLGRVNGPGDLTFLWNQRVGEIAGGSLMVQGGAKLSTGTSNAGGLPQAYQSGLGSNDLLLGATFAQDAWIVSVGYQWSRGRSDNAVTRLRRGDDLLVRAAGRAKWHRVDLTFGLLAIKRLHRASVLDTTAGRSGAFVEVAGSDQFQVNAVGALILPISESFGVAADVAVPLRRRDVNIDGLTRSFSIGVGVFLLP